jgi:hypothetical protein
MLAKWYRIIKVGLVISILFLITIAFACTFIISNINQTADEIERLEDLNRRCYIATKVSIVAKEMLTFGKIESNLELEMAYNLKTME